MQVDGGVIGQSKSIDRFVAKRFGFMGASDVEAAQVDMLGEHCSDIKKGYGDARAGKKDEALAAAKAEFLGPKLAEWAVKLEAVLAAIGSTGGFAVRREREGGRGARHAHPWPSQNLALFGVADAVLARGS